MNTPISQFEFQHIVFLIMIAGIFLSLGGGCKCDCNCKDGE